MRTSRTLNLRDFAPWPTSRETAPAPVLAERFKKVEEHRIAAVFTERWVAGRTTLACYTYAECRCGDRYVIRQKGMLVKDEIGWDARDEIQDAHLHFRRIYPNRLNRAYRAERCKVMVIS